MFWLGVIVGVVVGVSACLFIGRSISIKEKQEEDDSITPIGIG